MALRRINKEWKDIQQDPPDGVRAYLPNESDLWKWIGVVTGPEGTPYEGGYFEISIQFPTDYPFKPPKDRFITKVYSCDISLSGQHCLDIDHISWSPALTVAKLLRSMRSLLECPNSDDPIRADLAHEYKTDNAAYLRKARTHTQIHAIEDHADKIALFVLLFHGPLSKIL